MFLFSKIDLLGVPATLTFFGNEKRKSNFGGICTMLFLGFLAWSIYNSSLDLFHRTNPKINLSQTYVEDPREVSVSLDDFPIAFSVQGSASYNGVKAFSDPSIYTIAANLQLVQRVLQPNGTYVKQEQRIPLTLERCTAEYFGRYASSLGTFTFQGAYCISKNQTNQFKLQGTLSSTLFKGINGYVRMCNNVTSNGTCKSQDDITQAMSGSYFNVIYFDNLMNIQNYSYPTAKYRELYSTILNPKSYKELSIDIGLMSIATDSGLLTEETSTDTTFTVNDIKEIVDLNPSIYRTLVYFYIQESRTETFYTRSYKKIPTVLAEVGSLANVFLAAVIIFVSPYLRMKSREALMNEMFEIEGKQKAQRRFKPRKSAVYERQTSNGSPRKSIIEDEKKTKEKPKLKDLRLATLAKTFTTEPILLKDISFITPINAKQPDPQDKLTSKLQSDSEEYFNNQVWSPNLNGGAGISLFYTSDKKRQSDDLPTTPRTGTLTSRRLMSENRKVTKGDGDRFEEMEDDQDDIEKQLDNIDNTQIQIEDKAPNENMMDTERIKITPPEELGETSKEKAMDAQGEEKMVSGEKGPQLTSKNKSKNQSKSSPKTNKKNANPRNPELTFCEFMLSYIYKPAALKKKINAIQEGVKAIEERLDLSYIIKKFHEIDKLMALLLDRDQLEMFNNMPKPQLKKLGTNQIERKNTFELNLSTKIVASVPRSRRIEDYMQDSFERLQEKPNKSDIDKRLIAIFSDNGASSQAI